MNRKLLAKIPSCGLHKRTPYTFEVCGKFENGYPLKTKDGEYICFAKENLWIRADVVDWLKQQELKEKTDKKLQNKT